MFYVLGNNGDLNLVADRVSNADHSAIYRNAQRDHPDVVRDMYDTIADIVTRREFMQDDGKFPNSTWIGERILRSWARQDEWNAATANGRNLSNSLFGQIMWTVMFNHDLHWITTVTPNANAGRDERVYWVHPESQ